MFPYVAIFVFPAFVAMFEQGHERKKLTLGLAVYLLVLFVFIAFRQTGGDYELYVDLLDGIKGLSAFESMEMSDPLYGLLNWLSNQFGAGIYGVNVVGSILYLYGFYRFASYETRPILMLAVSMAYLVIVVVMGYSRQGIAIGILLWSYTFLYERKPFRFVVLCLIAAGFHRTAIVMLPFAYFAIPKTSGVLLWLIQVATIAVGSALIIYTSGPTADVFLANYVRSDHYYSDGALIRASMNATAAVVFFYYWKEWKRYWNDRAIWAIFAISAIVSVPMATIYATATDRMGLYLIPLQLVVFSRAPLFQKTESMAKFNSLIVITAYASTLIVWLNWGQWTADLWLPYKSLIFGEFE